MDIFLTLLLIVFVITFIVKVIQNKKRLGKVQPGTWALLIISIALVYIIGLLPQKDTPSQTTKPAASSSSKMISSSKTNSSIKAKPATKKAEKSYKFQSSINAAMLQVLTEDQGFGSGKLDENGNPLPNGQTREPNPNFAWALFVNKIEYYDAGTHAVRIYLNGLASTISKQSLLEVAHRSQRMAASVLSGDVANSEKEQDQINKDFSLDIDHKMDPYVVLVDANGSEIARTSAWTNQFKEKDF